MGCDNCPFASGRNVFGETERYLFSAYRLLDQDNLGESFHYYDIVLYLIDLNVKLVIRSSISES